MQNSLMKKGIVFGIIVLFIGTSVVPSILGNIGNLNKLNSRQLIFTPDRSILYVGGSGPGNYTKIWDAIIDASDGDTIFVYNDLSPYYEYELEIWKSINLIGEDKNTTVIDGLGHDYIFSLGHDQINISGFTLQNADSMAIAFSMIYSNSTVSDNVITSNNWWGIYLDGPSFGNNIIDNIITSNGHSGIYMIDSGKCNYIAGNTIKSNSNFGIFMDNCYGNNIIGNIISNNTNGVSLQGSSRYNNITGNTIFDNEYAVYSKYSNNNNIISNTISDNEYGVYIEYSSNINYISGNTIISNSNYNIYLDVSSNNTISNNTISDNDEGVYLSTQCNFNTVSNNIITLHECGINLLTQCNNNTISSNTISNNTYGVSLSGNCNNNIILKNFITNFVEIYPIGIYIRSWSNYNIIIQNTISNIFNGIHIDSGENNLIYHNNFVNINYTASEWTTNIWDNGYPSGGNYWYDYTGVDNYSGSNQDLPGSDGIGDTPYLIPPVNNKDNYPLMHPFETYYVLDIEAPAEVNENELFNVVVRSIGGTAIPNATVEFNDEFKLTDSDGRVYFNAPEVEEDTNYYIIATKEGYTGDTEIILVKDIPTEFVSCFILGLINNLTTNSDIITFKAKNIRIITFFPITLNAYKSGELIIISQEYLGIITPKIILALCGVVM